MEQELVQRLCERFPTHPAMKLGPGDDAAILELASGKPQFVVSTDLLTEGVDFLLARMNPRKIGRKALAVNVSDLAAMAADPLGCVISVALPRKPRFRAHFEGLKDEIFLPKGEKLDFDGVQQTDEACVAELMELLSLGFEDLTRDVPLAIAGGDTNLWDGGLVISVTVFGQVVGQPLCRSGAQPGDAIFVTGELGGSILRHQFDFTPRTREMAFLRERFPLHAGMDISDGLLLDLSRLLKQSGCGAVLDTDAVPISAAAVELSQLDTPNSGLYDWIPREFAAKSPLRHALSDGEDFEILFTVSEETAGEIERTAEELPVRLTRVGTITEGSEIRDTSGKALKIEGFVHSGSDF